MLSQFMDKKIDIGTLINETDIGSIKEILTKIVSIIDDPTATARDIRTILELDPPLMFKILSKANSAFFYKTPIKTIEEAVIWLGIARIKELILNQKICHIFEGGTEFSGYSRQKLWKHSISVALLTKYLFRREFARPGNIMYTMSLIHDIGLIIEDQLFHDQFQEILKAITSEISLLCAEKNILNLTHAQLGGMVCEHWQLPLEIVNSIKYHHNPFEKPHSSFKYTASIYICDFICQENEFSYYEGSLPDTTVFDKCMKLLNLKLNNFKPLLKDLKQEIKRMENEGLL